MPVLSHGNVLLFVLPFKTGMGGECQAGYGSFADAVNAYNEQYGTNYTVESAKEALGQ